MDMTFKGDDASLPADKRLHVHMEGVKALQAYNDGVLHTAPTTLVYSAETMASVLEAFQTALDSAHTILVERDALLKGVNESIAMLKAYDERLAARPLGGFLDERPEWG